MIVLPAVYRGVYFVLMKEIGVDENRPVTSLPPEILLRYRTCNSKFFSSDFKWVTIFQISGITVDPPSNRIDFGSKWPNPCYWGEYAFWVRKDIFCT